MPMLPWVLQVSAFLNTSYTTYIVTPPVGTADFALNTLDGSADQYAAGVRYHFSPFVSWYLVGSYLRDANNDVVAGNKAKAVTTGMTFDF